MARLSDFVIRPIAESDADALASAYEHDLSPESRYLRFHGGGRTLPVATLHYLTHVDGVDHVALVAVEEREDGAGLGVARFVRQPDAPTRAEVAVAVIDRVQGCGVGWALVRMLALAARARGIDTFTMLVLGENHRVVHWLGELRAHGHAAHGAVEYELPIDALLAAHA